MSSRCDRRRGTGAKAHTPSLSLPASRAEQGFCVCVCVFLKCPAAVKVRVLLHLRRCSWLSLFFHLSCITDLLLYYSNKLFCHSCIRVQYSLHYCHAFHLLNIQSAGWSCGSHGAPAICASFWKKVDVFLKGCRLLHPQAAPEIRGWILSYSTTHSIARFHPKECPVGTWLSPSESQTRRSDRYSHGLYEKRDWGMKSCSKCGTAWQLIVLEKER